MPLTNFTGAQVSYAKLLENENLKLTFCYCLSANELALCKRTIYLSCFIHILLIVSNFPDRNLCYEATRTGRGC